MVQVLKFYVTKIRVIKTGLQLAKTVKLCNNAVQRATQSSFVILLFVATALFQVSFGVPFTVALKEC